MPNPSLPAALALMLVAPEPAGGDPAGRVVVQTQQFSFHQRIIVRVPRLPDPERQASDNAQERRAWTEKKSVKCVPLGDVRGATLLTVESVDLMLADGQRRRAHFDDDCAALDFYSGFYIRPTSDGQLCARRDSIRSRSGGRCEIREIRVLMPRR